MGNITFFVIFAVLDVSLDVNLCINCSFLHLSNLTFFNLPRPATAATATALLLLLLLLRNASDLRNCTSYFGACMWVWYPHPFPSNWGRKRIYVLHGLWVILCYYLLDGSPLRGVASLLHCGHTPLVGVKITNFSKNAQNDFPWSKTPFWNPLG